MYRVIKSSNDNKTLCRVANYKEFDNGHVLFNYERMNRNEAEDQAKRASIKDPNNIYYVHYDDIMNPSSELRWIDGKSYHYSQVELQDDVPVIKASTSVASSTRRNNRRPIKANSVSSNLDPYYDSLLEGYAQTTGRISYNDIIHLRNQYAENPDVDLSYIYEGIEKLNEIAESLGCDMYDAIEEDEEAAMIADFLDEDIQNVLEYDD